MKKKVVGRVLAFIATLLFVSLFVFASISFAPGDSSSFVLSDEAGSDAVARYRDEKGLDDIFVVRYVRFMKAFFSLNWGKAISGESIKTVVFSRLPVTLSLSLFSITLSLVITLSVLSFSFSKGMASRGRSITVLSSIFLVIPTFLTSLILVLIFSLWLKLFPVSGYISLKTSLIGNIRSLFLPSLALSLLHSSIMMRLLREAVTESLSMPYTRTAIAKGEREKRVVFTSAFPVSLPVFFSLVSDSFATAFGGAAVVESVFALPGLGTLMVKGAMERDANLVSVCVMVVSVMVSLVFLLFDIASYIWDPRQRRSDEKA